MHLARVVFSVAAGVVVAFAATTTPARATPVQPGGGTVPAGQQVTVTLHLAGADPSGLEQLAAAVADPASQQHGKRLGRAQLRDRFGAPPAQVTRVTAWGQRAGLSVTGLDETGSRLTVTGGARAVGAAFGVGLRTETRNGVRALTATSTPRVPAKVRGDVQAVTGLIPLVARPLSVRPATSVRPLADGQYCSTYFGEWNKGSVPQKYPAGKQSNMLCGYNGAQLRAMYGLGANDRGQGQTIVIVGAYHSATALADANRAFAANGVPQLPSSRFVVKQYAPRSTVEGCDVGLWNMEQALDIQAAHTIAPDATIVYAAAPDCTKLPDTVAKAVADTSIDTTIISASWGITAGEPNDPGYLTAVNNVLARAALLGIGTYAASGDAGDNSNLPGASGTSVLFPASSPWVTAVGGTSTAVGGQNQVLFTTGWSSAANRLTGGTWQRLSPPFAGGAGGGNSAYFPKPSWQANTPGTRRSVPDIAALADPFTGFFIGWTAGGQYVSGPVGGTSLAAPIVASLAAVAQGRAGNGTVIGLAAPVLYVKAAAGVPIVTDVAHVAAGVWTTAVSADSPQGDYLIDLDAGTQSLRTGPGYDQITGLGVPGPAFLTAITA
ncbi:S53 family peptidase [Dactylosporangium sp. NPDC005572]|uniref:S53 family peptidase n=1 Tax=Dactylosporangium sp. NPDC005572 TaxID=3156889 RepID=UPI0033BC0B3F